MFEPPEMIRSFERSFSVKNPSGSITPTSPVRSQPSFSAAALASGLSR